MKKLIAGNWKMNLGLEEAKLLVADTVNKIYFHEGLVEKHSFLICPPFIFIPAIRHALRPIEDYISFGAQDCSPYDNGAHTGDISASMLADSGCSYVIVGHSERRAGHGESDEIVRQKAQQVIANGMTAIICVGESEAERESGREVDVVLNQLEGSLPEDTSAENTVIAYEPVWAIGTGKTATPQDAGDMHTEIRSYLSKRIEGGENIRILYGGSMKPGNAADLLATPNIDGGLIGGASLKADDFVGIGLAIK